MRYPLRIDWAQPVFSAYCLTIMFVAAYGGLRTADPEGIFLALFMLGLAWGDAYLTGEKKKALPRESYLTEPLPRLRR